MKVLCVILTLCAAMLAGCEREPATRDPADAPSATEVEPTGRVVDGVREIDVSARQFTFEPATIVVRQGEQVRLRLTSEDVTHGFGLDAYGINETLEPGATQTVEFTADEAGRHRFRCTVFCGPGHGDMEGELVVLENELERFADFLS